MSNHVFEKFLKNNADKIGTMSISLYKFLSVLIQCSLRFWQNTFDLVMELANPKMDITADHVLNFRKLHKWVL